MKTPRRTASESQPEQPQLTQPQLVEPQIVEIAKPVYGGSFLARVEGKAVFVPLVLPGEQARVRITEDKRGYSTAECEEIVSASPERVTPACRHFAVCGGCNYQHADYPAQLSFKQAILRETLERAGVAIPEEMVTLSAAPLAYRNRIRLAFDAAGNPGYRGRRSHSVIPISECPIAAPLLIQAAQAAAEVARPFAPAFRPTEIALFCNADESSLLASVFTASAKKVHFDEFAQALADQVPALVGAELVLEDRASEQPRTVAHWGAPSLLYRAAGFDYRVDRGAFFQVNRWLIDQFVERVTANHRGSLAWDLYAGVGLFARRLTASFTRVVAVESAPSATQALAANLKHTTGIPVRATTLDFLRRKPTGAQPDLIVPDLIIMDPPRSGLGPEVCALLAQFAAPALVYVSCDPATLARDLRALTATGYAVQSIALADLFPQTFHLETVAVLRHS
jgi:23S rRNA (uracil1939-C5)-methyltransferase